ncbi:hypothetical protein HMI55_003352, partial [Coelomomyces lativittatus]
MSVDLLNLVKEGPNSALQFYKVWQKNSSPYFLLHLCKLKPELDALNIYLEKHSNLPLAEVYQIYSFLHDSKNGAFFNHLHAMANHFSTYGSMEFFSNEFEETNNIIEFISNVAYNMMNATFPDCPTQRDLFIACATTTLLYLRFPFTFSFQFSTLSTFSHVFLTLVCFDPSLLMPWIQQLAEYYKQDRTTMRSMMVTTLTKLCELAPSHARPILFFLHRAQLLPNLILSIALRFLPSELVPMFFKLIHQNYVAVINDIEKTPLLEHLVIHFTGQIKEPCLSIRINALFVLSLLSVRLHIGILKDTLLLIHSRYRGQAPTLRVNQLMACLAMTCLCRFPVSFESNDVMELLQNPCFVGLAYYINEGLWIVVEQMLSDWLQIPVSLTQGQLVIKHFKSILSLESMAKASLAHKETFVVLILKLAKENSYRSVPLDFSAWVLTHFLALEEISSYHVELVDYYIEG